MQANGKLAIEVTLFSEILSSINDVALFQLRFNDALKSLLQTYTGGRFVSRSIDTTINQY
jgi:hypothetical protein